MKKKIKTSSFGFVSEGTLVTMADGTVRAIETISVEDNLKGLNGDVTRVKNCFSSVSDKFPLLRVILARGKDVICSRDNKFFRDKDIVIADDIRMGDRVKTISGMEIVAYMTYLMISKKMYMIETDTKSFYANGIAITIGE